MLNDIKDIYIKMLRKFLLLIILAAVTANSGCTPEVAIGTWAAAYVLNEIDKDHKSREAALRSQKQVKKYVHIPKPREPVKPKQPKPVTAHDLMENAIEAYNSTSFSETVRICKRILKSYPGSYNIKARACVLIGAVSYQYGQIEEAQRYFIQAYRNDPFAGLSAELFPPEMIDFYEKVNKKRRS